jgi:PAS domain S-box-containing protein
VCRRRVAATQRLVADVRALEAAAPQARLAATERPRELAQLAVSVNRLLERRVDPDVESRVLFDALALTLPELALVHTDTILYANQAAADAFGLEPDALIGKSVTDLVRPAYRSVVRKYFAGVIDGAEAAGAPIEAQLISGDDPGLWAELHSSPLEFEHQLAVLTVAKDITHRKSMEASLGRGKLQARITLESIGEGVVTTDTAGNIDYMNEAAEQLTGASRSGALGQRLTDLIAVVDETDR